MLQRMIEGYPFSKIQVAPALEFQNFDQNFNLTNLMISINQMYPHEESTSLHIQGQVTIKRITIWPEIGGEGNNPFYIHFFNQNISHNCDQGVALFTPDWSVPDSRVWRTPDSRVGTCVLAFTLQADPRSVPPLLSELGREGAKLYHRRRIPLISDVREYTASGRGGISEATGSMGRGLCGGDWRLVCSRPVARRQRNAGTGLLCHCSRLSAAERGALQRMSRGWGFVRVPMP